MKSKNINLRLDFELEQNSSLRLIDFFADNTNLQALEKLVSLLKIEKYQQLEISSALNNKIVVFTGSLENFTRGEAKALAEKLGAKVAGSVSKNTDYVVTGQASGSKLKKAEELGVTILNEEAWQNLTSTPN